jgi:hypothetical protein
MPSGRRTATALAVAAALAAGCGGGAEEAAPPAASERPAAVQPKVSADLALPRGVPDRANGPADPAAERVIRGWVSALRHGDVARAARYFALPSKFQNTGTPVLTLDSELERRAVNESLTCGALVQEIGGNGPYSIVTFRLTERPGGDCGTGAGHRARGAIRVARGRITEWYRLPDEPGGEPIPPPAPSGPSV